jgi:hypothetical protein
MRDSGSSRTERSTGGGSAADRVATQRAVGDKLLEDLADFLHSDFNLSRASASLMAFSKRASFSATVSLRIASRHAGFPRVALPISTMGIIQPRSPPSSQSSFLTCPQSRSIVSMIRADSSRESRKIPA